MWASRPTRCDRIRLGLAIQSAHSAWVVGDADPYEITSKKAKTRAAIAARFCLEHQRSLAEFAPRKARIDSNRFSGDMCGVVRPGALRSAAEASSAAAHSCPRSSSPNQSLRFDLERSGSGMSLLSRLRGSKGYGACRDAASATPAPRFDQAGQSPRDKREY